METELALAVQTLIKNLKADEGYRHTWVANIAMSFQDEWYRYEQEHGCPSTREEVHEVSNKAAKNFLSVLCR